jgi:hypothetical protein
MAPSYGIERVPTHTEFGRALVQNFHHFVALQEILALTRDQWHPCGTYLMGPDSMDYEPSMLPKQQVLFDQAKEKRSILEIGVHGAHSLLISLMANPDARITCVDICHWEHVEKCVSYLQTQFPDRIVFLKGDSRTVLPCLVGPFDMIHVDGDHSYEGAKFDMVQSHRLSHPLTSFVFDDYFDGIHRAVTELSGLFEVTFVPSCVWGNCLLRRRT